MEPSDSGIGFTERGKDSDGSGLSPKLKNDALMTGFLGLDFGKKDSSKERIETVAASKDLLPAKVSPKEKGETYCTDRPLEEIIADAAEYAVRQDEEYIMTSLKSCLEEYRRQKDDEKKAREVWMKVSLAEGGVILAMLAACITTVNLSKK